MKQTFALYMIATIFTSSCATVPPPPMARGVQTVTGPAQGPPGKVLVMAAKCGALDASCQLHWTDAVDAIVVGAMEFRGYAMIDPASLRKDEATRTEQTDEHESRIDSAGSGTSSRSGIVGIIPIISEGSSSSSSYELRQSRGKTVVLNGATSAELKYEDRVALMARAGAQSVLHTTLVVGADYGVWRSKHVVEVTVKLSDALDGTMRWSARCSASSADHRTVQAAIESAARCAAGGIAGLQSLSPR